MKIAIIGAGFTGLAAGYRLAKHHWVTIFEKDRKPGGLAVGYGEKEWEWTLEKHYHHWFTNDNAVLDLAKELHHQVAIKRSKTSVYLNNAIFQLDSPLHLLKFPQLPLISRLRMATVLAFLKYNPFWQPLEKIKTVDFLLKTMGKTAYEKIWEPQLVNKFGSYSSDISLAWFWARIKKRTPELAYPEGGFLKFANKMVEKIEKNRGKVIFNTEVTEIKRYKKSIKLSCLNDLNYFTKYFDKVIVTLPSLLFIKITPELPIDYQNKLKDLKGLGAINLVLRLKKQFLTDGTYWLSICDKNAPVMAVVEHTNFIDKKYYGNEHLVYLGNYLPFKHRYFSLDKDKLLKEYDPLLKKINYSYQESIIDSRLFTVPFAQPIIPTNYSKIMPSFKTPLNNVYLANIQQVYPWDRGTNYAVELGEKIAKIIMNFYDEKKCC